MAASSPNRAFSTGLELVNRIGASAYPEVRVTLSSHDVGGITSRDNDLARTISSHAADLGVSTAESVHAVGQCTGSSRR